ncbi:MAG: hypothetical protein WD603_01465 [Patescibacteria group bacterium]
MIDEPTPDHGFEPDGEPEEELAGLQPVQDRFFVESLEARELERASRVLDITTIHRLPRRFHDGDLERFEEHGVSVRFVPFRANSRPVPEAWKDVFTQAVDGPGWYAVYEEPLDAAAIARRGITQEPVTVAEFFESLGRLQMDLPGNPNAPLVLANAPELYYLLDRDSGWFEDGELMLSSAPSADTALALRFDGPKAEQREYRLDEPFGGAIYPLRRVA